MNCRYFVNSVEVFPLNNGTNKIVYRKEITSSVVFQKTLEGDILLNSTGNFNFKIQQALDPTEELNFIIKRKCGNQWETLVKLLFTVAEGYFDDDKCTFSIKTKTKSEFRKDIKVNIVNKQNLINIGSPLYEGQVHFLYNADEYYFKQGFYFDKTILSVAQQSNSKIKGIISNFFQINPTIISTDALPGVPNKWTDLVFSSVSDIQVPVPTGKAIVEFITFQELMDDLNVLFDVFWFIDENNNLRIEHRFFFDGNVGLDLTVDKYKDDVAGTKKYNYDLQNYPRTETIRVANSNQYFRFTNGYFATINANKSEVVRETKKINTDLTQIVYWDAGSSVDGVFLFAGTNAISGGSMRYSVTTFFGSDEPYFLIHENLIGQNVFLTPQYLSVLHLYGRYDSGSFYESLTNISPGTFSADPFYWLNGQFRMGAFKHKTVRPIILQEKFQIPLCCDDNFQPEELVKTSLGYGLPENASLNITNDSLELELKYKAPEFKFKPTDLTGLQLWLRGNAGIHISATPHPQPGFYYIDQWDDYSGNGRHAVSGATNKPYNNGVITGCVFGDFGGGGAAQLIVPSFQLFPNKRGTIFILYETDVTTLTRDGALISTINGGAGPDFDISVYKMALYAFSQTGSPNTFYYPQNLYTNQRLFQMKRYEDDKIICRDNSRDIPSSQVVIGTPNITLYNPATVDNVIPVVKQVIIGHNLNYSSGTISSINIREVIVYDHSLTDAECEKIELYLAKTGYYQVGATSLDNL